MSVIGIDLGTTYSCIGTIENERVEILQNDCGNRTTPSWVSFDDEILVGEAAKNNSTINTENTIFDIKRLMGQKYDDKKLQAELKHLTYKVVDDENRPKIEVDYKGERKKFTPEEISAKILIKMKEIGESRLGGDVKDCVITVPAYFNDSQRQATKDAGMIAGLNVLRIINEPTAAALAYGLDKIRPEEDKNILVYDFGGGTLDVSVVNISDGVFEVLGTSGDTHLGGEDIDNLLIQHILLEFKKKNPNVKIINENKIKNRLKGLCENAKRTLSSATSANIVVDSFAEGVDFSIRLTRAKLESLCGNLFKKVMDPLDEVLKISKKDKRSIDDVVLVGGSTRIPKIRQLLEEYFMKVPKTGINPDECVAYGATIQASILSGTKSEGTSNILLLDATPLTLGIETSGEISTPLIPKGTTIPTKKQSSFSTYMDNQPSATIKVLEGERYYSADNHVLGSFQLDKIPPGPRGSIKINVCYDMDANGILNVSADVENADGCSNSLVIKNDKSRLSEEEIERMRQDAEKYKEEDLKFKENRELLNNYEDQLHINLNQVKEKKNLKELEKLYEEEIEWVRNNTRVEKDVLKEREILFKEKEESFKKKEEVNEVKVEEVD